ncbi:MAG: hypothetical protein R3B13_09660 [Polyangiaceae bacterium]
MQTTRFVIALGLTLGLAPACGGGDEGGTSATGGQDAGSDAASGAGGVISVGGSGGAGALGGSAGSGGTAGSSGTSGASGSGGAAGSGGASGGAAGSGGNATGGSAGSGGSATGGTGGSATGGAAGGGGVGGNATGGAAGSGGSASGGTAGTGGSATGGAAGGGGAATGGTAGTGGATGGVAGGDAGTPECTTNPDCDNGVFCDGAETCVAGKCVSGTPVVCADDGKSCTAEVCDNTTNTCKTVLQDAACSDGLLCTGTEKCDPLASGADAVTGCVVGTPVVCNDGISCTVDSCSDALGKCVFTLSNAACDNGVYCDGAEVCDPPNGAAGTGCKAGTPIDCEDGIGCTVNSCDETLKSCKATANHAACSDNLYCNGAEVCDLTQGCIAASAVSCTPDSVACTVEACDETLKTCTSTPSNGLCSSGQICTASGCITVACTQNSDCDDLNPCNGTETCDTNVPGGACVGGTAMDCDDGIQCTLDECDPTNGQCKYTTFDGVCNDGDACNGTESCVVGVGCTPGTALTCDDGIACTNDTCLSSIGCSFTPDSSSCQDGSTCNGQEVCSAFLGCQPAPNPLQCGDDGIACTTEACVEGVGCVSTPDNSSCACGQTCNPSQGGCGFFCNVSTCQGKVYECGDCLDNDGDCKIDSADDHCIGVCDNNEQGFKGNISGQNNAPCKADCYFDQDTGAGNDDCYWSHKCDPLAVAPDYPPEGSQCSYNPNANIPGTSQSCSQLSTTQSNQCGSYCGPLVPNGCDCFGCCAIPGVGYTVYLGSEDSGGNGTCNLQNLTDPSKCKPCTQVSACLNTCENCEICLGKPTLPPECNGQTCPPGIQQCGLPGQDPCAAGFFCVTGCCQPVPG